MSTQTPDNHQLDVAVGIVSVAREINQYQPQYLTQVGIQVFFNKVKV